MTFESEQYKTTTRQRWEDYSSGCNGWVGSDDRFVGAREQATARGAL